MQEGIMIGVKKTFLNYSRVKKAMRERKTAKKAIF